MPPFKILMLIIFFFSYLVQRVTVTHTANIW